MGRKDICKGENIFYGLKKSAVHWSSGTSRLFFWVSVSISLMSNCEEIRQVLCQWANLGHPHKMFRFPSPSLLWRWVGWSGKKKNTWRGLAASEGRAAKPVVSTPNTVTAFARKKPWIQLCVKTKLHFDRLKLSSKTVRKLLFNES